MLLDGCHMCVSKIVNFEDVSLKVFTNLIFTLLKRVKERLVVILLVEGVEPTFHTPLFISTFLFWKFSVHFVSGEQLDTESYCICIPYCMYHMLDCFLFYDCFFRKVMLRVDAQQGAPRDGNSSLELFQVIIFWVTVEYNAHENSIKEKKTAFLF